MEGVKTLAGLVSQGSRDSFNSAYIFILNDRYPGQARQARAQAARAGMPGPNETSWCYGVQHFREAFSFHGEGQSRFNRDDVPRSWETGEEVEEECGQELEVVW